MINYTLDQKTSEDTSWNRSEHIYFNSLKELRKYLRSIKEYDKYEKRKVQYRIIKISESIIK